MFETFNPIVAVVYFFGILLNDWLWRKFTIQRWTRALWTPEMSFEDIEKGTKRFLEHKENKMSLFFYIVWPVGILLSLFLLYGLPLIDKVQVYRDQRRVKDVYKIVEKDKLGRSNIPYR